MKATLKSVSFAALALLVISPLARAAQENPASMIAGAEEPSRKQQMREARLQALDETLQLTAEQKAKINAIWDKAAEDARAMREDTNASRRERRKEQRALRQDLHQHVRDVLTPEQQKTFDKMPRPKPARAM